MRVGTPRTRQGKALKNRPASYKTCGAVWIFACGQCAFRRGQRSFPAPRKRHEQQQQREDLQTAEQHADHEHDLAQRRDDGKASGRSDKGEPRPDVGQARECNH